MVFDLEKLNADTNIPEKVYLKNTDLDEVGKFNTKCNYLLFESRFESGNLRRVVQVTILNF